MIGQWGALVAPCSTNPQQWDTTRTVDGREQRAPRAELLDALTGCWNCPLLNDCAKQDPSPNSIHAGVIYDSRATPYATVDAFVRAMTRAKSPGCAEKIGTLSGYYLHGRLRETPCDRCRAARNAAKRTWKPRLCGNGHEYTPKTTVLNKVGHRICRVCKPNAKGKPMPRPKPVNAKPPIRDRQMACKRSGHDWTDPHNVSVGLTGKRSCAECRRIDSRAANAAAQERRAARRAEQVAA